ncbi:MAG TPA: transcriptional regulator [Firmicutes bacterium]|jgi:hypothetical protein|nr:transcriptional regulator [Bacillota bacterium]
MFKWGLANQLVKNLRKNKGYTIAELAIRLKMDSIEIRKVDHVQLKDVPEPLKSRLLSIFRGDDLDKIPW